MFRRFLPAALVAVLSSGCSLRYVDGPPKTRPGAPIPATATCTTVSTMPIVDAILAVSYAWAIQEVLEDTDDFTSTHLAMFALPVGFVGSSIQGFRRIRACREFLATPVVPDTTGLPRTSLWPLSPAGRPPLVRPIPLGSVTSGRGK